MSNIQTIIDAAAAQEQKIIDEKMQAIENVVAAFQAEEKAMYKLFVGAAVNDCEIRLSPSGSGFYHVSLVHTLSGGIVECADLGDGLIMSITKILQKAQPHFDDE